MNEQPNVYDAVIADLRAKRDEIDVLIQRLELFRNWVPPPTGGGYVPEPSLLSQMVAAPASTKEIEPGTFHGMSIEDAARKLLQLRKRTIGTKEILASLRSGGVHLQSATPENTIASVLGRSFHGGSDIVRVGRGLWGLQEWYPNQRFNRGGED